MRKAVVIIALLILIIMAGIQIAIDCVKKEDNTFEVAKESQYSILVEIEDKTLYLLQDGKCIRKYPVASGMPEMPSPIGSWKIVDKGDWGEGFGGRWMGLNVPWGNYGIHGTMEEGSIGYSASHGCIRMYNSNVRELFRIVPVGTPVVIVDGCFGPFGTGFKTISSGDRGADVLAIEQRLKELGYYKGRLLGIYEEDLKIAVHRFQKDKGLQVKNEITKKDFIAMGFKEFE